MIRLSPVRPAILLLALLPTICGLGCTLGGRHKEGFVEVSQELASAPGALIAVGGKRCAFVVLESGQGPGGEDLNEDGDFDDSLVAVGKIGGKPEVVLDTIASEFQFNEAQDLYLAVDESEDGKDWSEDGDTDDLVLLHWSANDDLDPRLAFVDLLRSSIGERRFVVVRERVYYGSGVDPAGGDGTSLRYLDRDDPRTPVEVLAQPGAGLAAAGVLDVELELVLVAIDESATGLDANGDGDAADVAVLGLLDGTDETATLVSTGLALDPGAPVFDVWRGIQSGTEWQVAFLVDELSQGGGSLNDPNLFLPGWEPPHCAAAPDLDLLDDVLHFASFESLLAGTGAPTNTGLAGEGRVVMTEFGVATLQSESLEACDLNLDGDLDDRVVRYAPTALPIMPATLPEDLLALALPPGGADGLAGLDGRLLVVVDEEADGEDHDGDGAVTRDLLAWVDPVQGPPWEFVQRDADGLPFFVGVEWMGRDPVQGRLALSFQEEVQGKSLNSGCKLNLKDADALDALPAWPRFSDAGLVVPGVGFALPPGEAGLLLFGGQAFFRCSESADAVDHNKDGDLDDVVLVRASLTSCAPRVMDTASLQGLEVLATGGLNGAAFLAEESMAGEDYNLDGDTLDFVVRTFTF